jgi:hypothetical protein
MGTYHPAAESKAAPKATGQRVQEVTIEDGETASTGYFTKEARDLVAIKVDANFGGTQLTFNVRQPGETAWNQLAWAGTDPHTETISEAVTVDPAIFAGWGEIQVVSDAAQSGSDCVVTGYFRDFRA